MKIISIASKDERYSRYIVAMFFGVFLILGLSIYRDYGVSWDEELQRTQIGEAAYQYITGENTDALFNGNEYHGPAFELLLILPEKIFAIADTRQVYFVRHFVTFLVFFLSVWIFYLICRDRFSSWKLGLLGSLFLILSPRIFAEAFYNPKDIPFLSIYIIGIYTLIKFHRKQSYLMAVLHALVCAFLIDIRIMGIVIPAISFFLVGVELLRSAVLRVKPQIMLGSWCVYVVLLGGFTTIFWPVLWEGPFHHFIEAFKQMSRYPWGGEVLYLGKSVNATELPWHYLPVWVAITTPALYVLLFIVGVAGLLRMFLKHPLDAYVKQPEDVAIVMCFFAPVSGVILMKAVLYDAWRHMYFIYPAFLLITLHGFVFLWNLTITWRKTTLKAAHAALLFFVVLAFGKTLLTMIAYHPYQNVYFNFLAGPNMEVIKSRFEMDYWGLSYRKALEYILARDTANGITLAVANYPGFANSLILPLDQRRRLRYTRRLIESDYFLSNYRGHPQEYPLKNEFFSITLDGAKIMVVYKIKA